MLVALSDMHFGLKSCTLKDTSLVDRLVEELSVLKPEEIVIIGDVFDLWDANPEVAIGDSRYFFERLATLKSKIVYIIGNHDHHLKVIDSEQGLYGTGGEPKVPYRLKSPFFNNLFSAKNMEVHYQEYSKNIYGKDFLFTHGHYFIGENSTVPQVLRELGILRKSISKSVENYKSSSMGTAELEETLTESYETLYWSTLMGGLKGKMSGIWYELERLIMRIFGRESSASYFSRTRQDVLRYLKGRKFDYVVFGHSHRAGVYSDLLTLVNTGAWCTAGTYEPDAVNCYAIVEGADVRIRRLE